MNKIPELIKKLKVLYVEDNPEARESTSGLLQIFFPDLVIAIDGEDGYNTFMHTENKFDIVISDESMPKMNGVEMLKKIQEHNKDIYTIMLSAYANDDFLKNKTDATINALLMKPIDINEFTALLKKIEIYFGSVKI